jgi:LAS superfamily LD-carboxypeptidase LdcB
MRTSRGTRGVLALLVLVFLIGYLYLQIAGFEVLKLPQAGAPAPAAQTEPAAEPAAPLPQQSEGQAPGLPITLPGQTEDPLAPVPTVDPESPYGKALANAAAQGLPTPPDIDLASWEFTLVNGDHSIDRYEPEQLAYLNQTLAETDIQTSYNGNRCPVDIRIAEPLIAMGQACKDAGLPIFLSSGYRSYSDQAANFTRICQNNGITDGKDGAGHYITMPAGCSEHQLALCCDITDKYYATKTPDKVASPTIDWLLENCADYGFVQRFPSGKEDITGVMNETWHFRYVGVEAAHYMTDNHLVLEEFLALYGVE